MAASRRFQTPAPAVPPSPSSRPERARTWRIVGIDLSLTATGLAQADGTAHTIRTGPGDHLADQHDRLTHIVNEIAERTAAGLTGAPDLAVIEGPSYGSNGAGTWDRAGLWWLVIDRLFREGVPVAVVPPTVLKRYATGKGNATKPDMRMALYQRLGLDLRDDNQVDAIWLRAMGLDQLGCPLVDMPQAHRAALDKVTWPALTIHESETSHA